MWISERAVDYPRLVFLGAVSICVFGILSLLKLPIERTPRFTLPKILVITPNPGASPETNEAQISRRIEEKAAALDGLDYVVSKSMHGASVVELNFADGTDVKEAKRDVHDLVDQIRGELPAEVEEPIVQEIGFQQWPVVQVVLAGEARPQELREAAESLKDRLEGLPGVAGVDLFGGQEQELHVLVNPHVLDLYGLGFEDVALAVASANAEAPTGTIDLESGGELRVRFRGKYDSLEQVARTPLTTRGGKLVLLGDVARVVDSHKRITSYASFGGKPAVALQVRPKADINTLATVDAIKRLVEEQRQQLGERYAISTFADQGRDIRIMTNQLGSSALYGLGLVLVILVVAMGVRNAALVGVAMPFSLLTAAALMLAFKHTLDEDTTINNTALFSVILVIGMVVDGALIVGENIYRHLEQGRGNYEAAKLGIREVGPAVISADLTTISAFVPMLFVSGLMGQFSRVIPITVALTLLASMAVDHLILPAMSCFVMRPKRREGRADPAGIDTAAARLPALGAEGPALAERSLPTGRFDLSGLEITAERGRIRRAYGEALRHCIQHRLIVLLTSGAAVGLALFGFLAGVLGYEFFPQSDVPQMEINFEVPLGSGIERARQVATALEEPLEDLKRRGELESDVLTVLGQPGALNIRLDNRSETGPEFGRILLELKLARERDRSTIEIARWLRENLPTLPDVKWYVHVEGEGPPVGADIVVRVMGGPRTRMDDLARASRKIERMLAGVPGTTNVRSEFRLQPETVVTPRPRVAALFGVTNQLIARTVQFALQGVEVTDMDFGRQADMDIRIQSSAGHRNELIDLEDLPLRGVAGRSVSLEQVADVRREFGPHQIMHRQQNRVIHVRADLQEGVLADDVFAALDQRLEDAPDALPGEIALEYSGENEERDRSLRDLQEAMAIGAILILVILTAQFNSFSQPIIIMLAIPLAFVGVVLGLLVCGYNFSIATMIGVVALTGIVVNDAIVLVDFINQMRRQGLGLNEAIIRAGQLRLRPVFLTTVTTIGGLLPLALNVSGGGEFWQPLTVSVMFGVGCATVLTLLVIPTVYHTIVTYADRVGAAWGRSWAGS